MNYHLSNWTAPWCEFWYVPRINIVVQSYALDGDPTGGFMIFHYFLKDLLRKLYTISKCNTHIEVNINIYLCTIFQGHRSTHVPTLRNWNYNKLGNKISTIQRWLFTTHRVWFCPSQWLWRIGGQNPAGSSVGRQGVCGPWTRHFPPVWPKPGSGQLCTFIHYKRPQTATPALIKVQPTG